MHRRKADLGADADDRENKSDLHPQRVKFGSAYLRLAARVFLSGLWSDADLPGAADSSSDK